MTDVVVRVFFRVAESQGEAWLCAIERLDLTLLVERQDNCPLGRSEIETHDIPDFFNEQWISR